MVPQLGIGSVSDSIEVTEEGVIVWESESKSKSIGSVSDSIEVTEEGVIVWESESKSKSE